MHLRIQAPIPHPFVSSLLFLLLLLPGLPVGLFAQHKKLSRSDLNKIRIDSIFKLAEQNRLNTKGVLRYEFYFSDPDKKRFPDFIVRMTKDSFEADDLQPNGKIWTQRIYKNTSFSRENIYNLQSDLRRIKYSYAIDHYLGFTIKPADPDPIAVPNAQFSTYLQSLTAEQLYWVGKRLLDLKSFDRAILATELAITKKINPDTSHYRYGLALVATHEPADGINQWKKAVKLNPQYLEAFLALGKIHYENGYFNEALGFYQKADSISPNNNQILLHIAETLYALELFNQSYDYAMRSHKLDRQSIYTKSLLKLLNESRVKYLRKKYPEK